ncbi:hypothetical protein E2562_035822 [Oryza meyeriana var. granulata]|uniref:Uncharacterized protein n=1 Tax=Oryza meyeriana var. granulata TaxID=110450 RepID=A0A6G1DAU0_9ORYZ|nr:hypothetical protein E2562_035822 [Oryza meyeriana var. granulata]
MEREQHNEGAYQHHRCSKFGRHASSPDAGDWICRRHTGSGRATVTEISSAVNDTTAGCRCHEIPATLVAPDAMSMDHTVTFDSPMDAKSPTNPAVAAEVVPSPPSRR